MLLSTLGRVIWVPIAFLISAMVSIAVLVTLGQEQIVRALHQSRSEEDVIAALCLCDAETSRIGRAARERTLAEHTSDQRANELLAALEAARERPNAKHQEKVA